MPGAVVLLNVETGRERDVAQRICALEGVERAYVVYGAYDVVVIVSSETMEGLEALLMQKVRNFTGIMNTMTLLISSECMTERP